jgi:hypothetical protein
MDEQINVPNLQSPQNYSDQLENFSFPCVGGIRNMEFGRVVFLLQLFWYKSFF